MVIPVVIVGLGVGVGISSDAAIVIAGSNLR